jgi:hypothetical protein
MGKAEVANFSTTTMTKNTVMLKEFHNRKFALFPHPGGNFFLGGEVRKSTGTRKMNHRFTPTGKAYHEKTIPKNGSGGRDGRNLRPKAVPVQGNLGQPDGLSDLCLPFCLHGLQQTDGHRTFHKGHKQGPHSGQPCRGDRMGDPRPRTTPGPGHGPSQQKAAA